MSLPAMVFLLHLLSRPSSWPLPRGCKLDEGAKTRDVLANDQRVHLARAFIGIDSFSIGDEAPNVILEQDAVAAEQFARPAYGLAAPDAAERFRQPRNLVGHAPFILQLRHAQAHRLRLDDVAEHTYQQVLYELEARYRLAELQTLCRVAQRVFVSPHLAADGEPRHACARHPEDFAAVLEGVGILQPV